MPVNETITIINNSGKIISTGKQLLGIFKEAKASYDEKKAAIRSERAFRRAQTFDVSHERSAPYHHDEYVEYVDHPRLDDGRSYASSRRSHGSRHSHSSHRSSRDRPPKARSVALTETNLRALTEVSATQPSELPRAYRSPYCETAPRDMALSKPTLARAPTESVISGPRRSMTVQHRARSDPDMRSSKDKEMDMHLAYGNIPPDLASRVDLDPNYQGEDANKAHNLVNTIEGLLDEAHCVQHSATAIIAHLQTHPEAAAAVALTLAELSTLLAKMSPAFLGMIKGGSPAVFALLASPQFLIGAGVAVGVTVVMFGGWKIIKRMQAANEERRNEAAAMAFAAEQGPPMDLPMGQPGPPSLGFDEALVLEEELSTIDSWRRGIPPVADDESADIELISPEAERAYRAARRRSADDGIDPSDSISHAGRTERSGRTHRSSRSHRSHRSKRDEIPERTSSTGKGHSSSRDKDGDSEASGSHKSHRSSKHKRGELKAIEEGSRASDGNELDLVLRPKDRKNSLLKSIFKKKKDKEDHEKEKVSALRG